MIAVEGLSARAGAFRLADVTFAVPQGGYGVVLGPAGAGKTTLLEAIAGLATHVGGTVRLAGRDVSREPPEARGVGLVYQHAYLFPHLGVAENVAYGAADADAAREAMARFGVDALAGRRVGTLSGGERQLVALARAAARRPRVLLLDEPFGALDPRRRARVRHEVRALHREWGLTTLHVTHDFAEAGLLGDVLVVLEAGRVLQAGAPEAVFRRPASPSVAAFLGAENVYAGVARAEVASGGLPPADDAERVLVFEGEGLTLRAVTDREPGPCHAVVRAEEVVLARAPHASSARNALRGVVREVHQAGALARVMVDVAGTPVVAALTAGSAAELALREGDAVWASCKAHAVHLC
ncbi:MAG TPA: ATP-binding cassette domain-containing protein [Gemmatimonadaceae bacterium]|nr:ATP-binding cassette domain-containing protein [Gemmatimonadaceae bacterium]